MPTLYRVFPHLAGVAPTAPGGALYLPPQSGGRIDNPELYTVLYLSDCAPGAIAEAFGRFPEWTPPMLEGSPSLPGSVRAIASYRLREEARVCDMDDPAQLLALAVKPSDIVSRDYARTRAWARRIYEQGVWAGIRWWSYYHPEWASFGLWDLRRLALVDVRTLHLDDSALREAARVITRRVVPRSR